MSETVHVEIDFTFFEWNKEYKAPIIECKCDKYDSMLGRILHETIYSLWEKEFIKNYAEENKQKIKDEVIKDYLQNLLKENEKNDQES